MINLLCVPIFQTQWWYNTQLRFIVIFRNNFHQYPQSVRGDEFNFWIRLKIQSACFKSDILMIFHAWIFKDVDEVVWNLTIKLAVTFINLKSFFFIINVDKVLEIRRKKEICLHLTREHSWILQIWFFGFNCPGYFVSIRFWLISFVYVVRVIVYYNHKQLSVFAQKQFYSGIENPFFIGLLTLILLCLKW